MRGDPRITLRSPPVHCLTCAEKHNGANGRPEKPRTDGLGSLTEELGRVSARSGSGRQIGCWKRLRPSHLSDAWFRFPHFPLAVSPNRWARDRPRSAVPGGEQSWNVQRQEGGLAVPIQVVGGFNATGGRRGATELGAGLWQRTDLALPPQGKPEGQPPSGRMTLL